MSTTLSYGYIRPVEGDLASVWMDALEDDITQLNDHTHNGSDSALIGIASISKSSSVITALSWTDDLLGNYSKIITVPAVITEINNYHIDFYITATGVRIHPTVERVTATSYRIRLSQQLAITALYV